MSESSHLNSASMASHELLPRHIDDSIASMIFSMIGQPSFEEKLHYQLSLSQTSIRILQSQIKDSQAQLLLLDRKYQASQAEARLNESVLNEKIANINSLRAAYDQLLEECELFRKDREIFAEATEDSEERRAEADKRAEEAEARAAEAEVRAEEAERKDMEAKKFIKNLVMASPGERVKILSKARFKDKLDTKKTCHRKKKEQSTEHISYSAQRLPDFSVTTAQAGSIVSVNSPNSRLHKEGRGTKRVLLDACTKQRGCKNAIRHRTGNNALVENKQMTPICKANVLQTFTTDEKENFGDLDAETRTIIEEAKHSENETTRFLVHLLVVLKKNLVKAEAEGEILFRKCCELEKLLRDTGVLPGVLESNIQSVTVKEYGGTIEDS